MSAYIFFTLQEAEIVVPDRGVQWSTPWVVFLWRPIKVPLVCGFKLDMIQLLRFLNYQNF